MTDRVLTVVLQYKQGEEFPKELSKAFQTGETYRGVTVTAMSMEDEITRVEELEERLLMAGMSVD